MQDNSYFCFMHRFIPFVAILLCSFAPHKFYVSKTMVEFNPRSQGFEVTCKFFTDDLEVVISKMNGSSLKLGEGEVPKADQLIESHIQSHFKMWFDDQLVVMRFVGKEVEGDMTYCYLEFFRSPQYHALKIENSCLMEDFPDQQNIVDLKAEGTTSTVILSASKNTDVIFR